MVPSLSVGHRSGLRNKIYVTALSPDPNLPTIVCENVCAKARLEILKLVDPNVMLLHIRSLKLIQKAPSSK